MAQMISTGNLFLSNLQSCIAPADFRSWARGVSAIMDTQPMHDVLYSRVYTHLPS